MQFRFAVGGQFTKAGWKGCISIQAWLVCASTLEGKGLTNVHHQGAGSVMSSPSVSSLHHLRKLSGFMKSVGDVGVKMQTPQPGIGKMQSGGSHSWILESYSDADWSSNKSHRRSTSCGVHMLNGCFMYGSSRSQKVISLSSCESELHSLVSCACDGIFIRACVSCIGMWNTLALLKRW